MIGGLSMVASAQNTPCTATGLTVGTTCTATSGDNSGATDSGIADPGCASYGGGDIWFSVTVPASGDLTIETSNNGGFTDSGLAIYSGSCASPTLISCDDDGGTGTMSLISDNTLTPGSTLLIRVWEYGGNSTGTVGICVVDNNPGGGGGGVANDDCGSAIPLTVGATCTATSGDNTGAGDSGVPDPGCASYNGGDLWYSVTVPASGDLTFETVDNGGFTDAGMAIYSGSCGALTLISCNDDGGTGTMSLISDNTLTPGSTVYIRVWEYGNNATGTVGICVVDNGGGGGGATPANDECTGAIALTVNASATCTTPTSGTIENATASTDPGTASCGGTADDDVWYSFVATDTDHNVTISNTAGSTTDMYHSVYEAGAGCPTLGAEIVCSDPDASTLTGLTIGATYYVRVYTWTSTGGQTSTFDICITSPNVPPTDNSACDNMEAICTDNSLSFTGQAGGIDADVLNPGNDYGCLSSQPNPTWFYFEIDNPGDITFDMSSGADIDFALWGPYPDLATAQGQCNSLPAPIDCSFSTSNTETADITGAQAGEVYILLITNYANVTQVIIADQTGGLGTTDCTIVNPPACDAEAGSW